MTSGLVVMCAVAAAVAVSSVTALLIFAAQLARTLPAIGIASRRPSAWRQLLHWIAGYLPVKIRRCETEEDPRARVPLYERYFVHRLRGGGCAYLHHYLRSDPDRGPHDHPWPWAIAIPLARGYIEERVLGWDPSAGAPKIIRVRRWPFVPRLMNGYDLHRVILPPGETSWSLFIHGSYCKGWGFLRPLFATQLYGDGETLGQVGWRYRAVRTGADEDPDWWSNAPRGRDVARAAP